MDDAVKLAVVGQAGGVDYGGVAGQQETPPQAVGKYRRNQAALPGGAGFLFNQRSQRHQLMGSQVLGVRPLGGSLRGGLAQPGIHLPEALHHCGHHLLRRGRAGEVVSVRKEVAFQRGSFRGQAANQLRVFSGTQKGVTVGQVPPGDFVGNLPMGPTFRDGQGVHSDLAALQLVEDAGGAARAVEQVLARFQGVAGVEVGIEQKRPARIEDAASGQPVGNGATAHSLLNHDDRLAPVPLVGPEHRSRGESQEKRQRRQCHEPPPGGALLPLGQPHAEVFTHDGQQAGALFLGGHDSSDRRVACLSR